MTREDYNEKIIEEASSILKGDGVIIVPTDTVYGIAINSASDVALKKVYEIKKRSFDKRLPIVVDTYKRLMDICCVTMDQLKRLQLYYPGKVTLVLKKRDSEETVAVRMINNEIINKLIEKLDSPLMLTSANISGKKTSNDIINIIDEFDGKVDMVIMGNKISNVSSTIVELKGDKLVLVREGAISFCDIEKAFYRR